MPWLIAIAGAVPTLPPPDGGGPLPAQDWGGAVGPPPPPDGGEPLPAQDWGGAVGPPPPCGGGGRASGRRGISGLAPVPNRHDDEAASQARFSGWSATLWIAAFPAAVRGVAGRVRQPVIKAVGVTCGSGQTSIGQGAIRTGAATLMIPKIGHAPAKCGLSLPAERAIVTGLLFARHVPFTKR